MTASIKLDALDSMAYLHTRNASQEILDLEADCKDDITPTLIRDVWASAYVSEPEMVEFAPPSLLERRLIKKLLANPTWESVRGETVQDEWLSAALAPGVTQKLLAAVPDEPKKLVEEATQKEKEAQEFRDQAETLAEMAAQVQEQDEKKANALQKQVDAANQAATQAQANAEAAGQAAVEMLEQDGQQLDKNITKVAVQAAEDARNIKEAMEACSGWGKDAGQMGTGAVGREILEIAQLLQKQPRLKEIIKMAGRFTRIALQKKRNKIKHQTSEITEIEIGDDLSRVLPSELAALADPDRELDFYRRYLEKQLLQYRLDDRHPEGRGPLVVCIDESSSMAGNKELWAKAVALACFNLAASENRGFAVVHFGSQSEITVDRFPKPRLVKSDKLFQSLLHFFNGGTDFEAPLSEAMAVMEDDTFQKGDVIFITDGECAVSAEFHQEFSEAKQRKEFSVFAILVQTGTEKVVKPFADKIMRALPTKNDIEVLENLV
jgi:uncharacterized protein with von Willebrand factor type A (vWA) domain